jgi:hypothetical protein
MTDFKADMIMTAALLEQLDIKEEALEAIGEELFELDFFVQHGKTYEQHRNDVEQEFYREMSKELS